MPTEQALLRDITEHVARNRLEDAARLCATLNKRFPNSDGGWCAASVVACRSGSLERGLACAERAIQINAQDSNNWFARANVLVMMKRFEDALSDARRALELNPNDPKFLDNAGGIASRVGNFELADHYYSRLVDRAPTSARAHFNLGTVKRFLGQGQEAASCFDKAIGADPHDYDSYLLRSDVATQTGASNHVDELSALLDGSVSDWRGEMKLCFALAKELEDLCDFSRSFQYLERGATLRRRHMTYDVATDEQAIQNIRNAFTDSHFSSIQSGTSTDKPIFIVGLPRTGTTLVERILSSHSEVESLGELNDFALELTASVKARVSPSDRSEFISASAHINFDELGRGYLQRVSQRRSGQGCFIDKLPLNYLYCGLIHKALPSAKIIHVTRHPLDACYAMYKRLFRDAYPMSYDLEDLARYYLSYQRLMSHWYALMPGMIHSLSYESLVRDLEGETRRLLSFCELNFEASCLDFHRNPVASTTASASQIREPIYSSSVGKWKHYSNELTLLVRLLEEGGIVIDPADKAVSS